MQDFFNAAGAIDKPSYIFADSKDEYAIVPPGVGLLCPAYSAAF
jgi:hypothetical protein